jgi:hypothetical protein
MRDDEVPTAQKWEDVVRELNKGEIPEEPEWIVESLGYLPLDGTEPEEGNYGDGGYPGEEIDDEPGAIHPSGKWQVVTTWLGEATRRQARVVDVETRITVWKPEGAIEIAWSPDGSRAGVIREEYEPAPDHPESIGTPLQNQFLQNFQRYSWPEKLLLGRCDIWLPMGWISHLALSPRNDLALFQWFDQGESGLEFIILSHQGDHQEPDPGFTRVFNLAGRFNGMIANGAFPLPHTYVTSAIFSPSGRYIAVGLSGDWDYHEQEDVYLLHTHGTLYLLGQVLVLDWDERTVHEISVTTAQQMPADVEDDPEALRQIRDVRFLDDYHVLVTCADGSLETYSVQQDGKLIP